ncbi:Pyruvate kinase [uncultured Ruminococcus sp.]|uniref:Pyruvate kinase n=1 Tax=Massiliimalia timonensis TaxID=1987501 RepID=A0A8J6NZ48_9FIRM|nr:pyruvate kinase [Massiliimalia timonensis]MBC8609589.1 pyruvate kinase [Massiliimalia timonensis]SCH36126.1 Pyruvate kinase [uncultured Ruminococcus sp.]SCH38216.1 Pyruvate kinase [uncultured Clostridium sp.]
MRKTKIICTMGPANDDEQVLRKLMLEGMDAARFNFSHADHASHKKKFDLVVKLREELGLPIATILDTKGPEIRIGTFKTGKAELKKGNIFTLTTREVPGDENAVSITYADLPKDIQPGATVLLDDGLIALQVVNVTDTDIICNVLNSGVISNSKGINVPGTRLSMPFVSERDRADIEFGIKVGFDYIAASFTRSAEDILEVRKILDEHHCHHMNIIAKIENAEGVNNIDEIIRVTDGIMVARGDMGVEIPLEEVPVLQKKIIKKAYTAGKQVVTATQMLDSMMKNPRPTRAEATDVANAIYDGTSVIMLSGETAAGQYPVEALQTMVKIAERTEQDIDYIKRLNQMSGIQNVDITNAISHATCTTAHDLGASAIVTVTKSGKTARMISKFRPKYPIIGCTTQEVVYRQLNLSWGVRPLMVEEKNSADELFDHAVDTAEKAGCLNCGDLVVITAGVPLGISGTTNMMKVHVVGHILISGHGITQHQTCGRLCVCSTEQEALERFKDGDILVIPFTSNKLMPILKNASGIITEEDGTNSHAAIAGMAMDIPVIVGAENATKILKMSAVVNMDASKGTVSCTY